MAEQPQSAHWVRWQQLLQLGEQLMSATSLTARHELIVAAAARLFTAQVELWLSEAFHLLPDWEESPSFPMPPPTELMRLARETGKLSRRTVEDQLHGPAVALPLLANGAILGVLQVERSAGPTFSQADIELLEGLAIQSAIGLQAALQVDIERWRIEQLSLVRMVSSQVANVLELDELFRRVADLILDTFKYYYVALFTWEPGQEFLQFRASAGPVRSQPAGERQRGAVLHVRMGEGIIGYVAQTGEEVVANDVSRESRYSYADALPETRSEVALPLKIEKRILGVLDVQSDQLDDFHETDMLVLRALAHNISIAVEGARLYDDLRRRADQLASVAEVSRAVASILDLDNLFDQVVSLIHKRLGYPFVHLFALHPGRREVVYRAGSGRRSQTLRAQGLVYDLDNPHGLIVWAARHGQTALANDVDRDPRYCPSELPPANTRSEMAVPLIFGGEVLGVLDVQSDRRNAFSADDQFLLETLADNVAIAIRNANLYRSERWRRQVADSLREVAGLLSADLALDQVLDAILTELEHTLPCDVAAIWLLHQGDQIAAQVRRMGPGQPVSGDELRLAAVHGCAPDEVASITHELAYARFWLEQALDADQPVIRLPDSPAEPLGATLGYPAHYSAIAAPLRIGDQRLGVLVLAHRTAGRYGGEAQAMTAAFASYASVAIENTRLYEAAKEQAWISTVLLQVAEATRSLTSLDQVLETVVRLLPMLAGVGRCMLLLSQKGESWYEPVSTLSAVAAYGFSPAQQSLLDRWRVAPGDVPAFDLLRLVKSPIVIQDALSDARLPGEITSALGLRSILLLPLLARGELLGAMLVDYWRDRPEYDGERLVIMQGIAHQIATAIENTRLLEARQEEAYVSAALLQVAQAVASLNELDDILSVVVRIMPMLVGVEWCVIFLWTQEGSVFWPAHSYGVPVEVTVDTGELIPLPVQRYAPGDFPMLDAVRESGEPIALDILSDWDDWIRAGLAADFVAYLRSMHQQGDAQQSVDATRSLLAVPLAVKGDVLGVLLVEQAGLSDRLRDRGLEIITGIAQQAALAVQNDLLQQEMAERERLEQELQLAREIQQSFMPRQSPRLAGWEMEFLWRSARQVAGDFYDFFELPNRRLGIVIADVADKGMPAALFMTLTRTLVRAAALEDDSPSVVLARVNDLLVADIEHGMFVTAIYAVLSVETGELAYANAGHPVPLVWHSHSQSLRSLSRGGMALGVLEGLRWEDRYVYLEPGDHLILYTDGITEASSPQNQLYGQERLEETIRTADDSSALAMLQAIDSAVSAFVGDNPPSDDVTLVVLRRLTH